MKSLGGKWLRVAVLGLIVAHRVYSLANGRMYFALDVAMIIGCSLVSGLVLHQIVD